jgi:integrase
MAIRKITYKIKSGRVKTKWGYEFKIKLLNGTIQRIRKYTFDTKAEAVEAQEVARFKKDETRQENITFEMVLKHFIDYKRGIAKPSTIGNYITMTTHFKPLLDKTFKELSSPFLLKYRNDLIGAGKSNYRINRIFTLLVSVFDHANTFFSIVSNTAKQIPHLREERRSERAVWTIEEFKKFIATFDTSDNHQLVYRSFFEFLFFSGCRRGEALALKVKDLDINNKSVRIDKNYIFIEHEKRGKRYQILETKTKDSDRNISLNNQLIERLKELIEYKKKCQGYNDGDCFLFGAFNNRPFSITGIGEVFRLHIRLAEVKYITLHCLRHSHASMLINNGIDPFIIAKRLGHASMSTTLSTYAHLYKNRDQIAVDKINELLDEQ